jgi:UDP-N-acetylmuramate dehydrogenase
MTAADRARLMGALNTLGVAGVRGDEPLARHTTFGIGGPAAVLVEPPTRDQLLALLPLVGAGEPAPLFLGLGSNLLVSDRGFDGVVVKALRALRGLRVDGEILTVEAGVSLKKASTAAAQAGLSGLEFAISIPGTVGGAVTMNAGAHGAETRDVVETVTVWTGSGVEELPAAALALGYRDSLIQRTPGWMVLEARLRLTRTSPAEVEARMRALMRHRLATQPVGERNAGSMFKNPPGDKAGALIERVGAKGWREGAAEVSALHANFIVNRGGARAWDVVTLMRRVRQAVHEACGIVLFPEVRWVGPDEGEAGATWDNLWWRAVDGWRASSG